MSANGHGTCEKQTLKSVKILIMKKRNRYIFVCFWSTTLSFKLIRQKKKNISFFLKFKYLF